MKRVLIVLLLISLMLTSAGCSCRINISTKEDESAAEESAEINAPDEEMTEDPEGAENGLIGYTEGLPGGGNSYNPGGTQQEVTIAPPSIPTISFPYAITGTDLVVQQVSSYSGYYIEDASDREVSNIAAIVLTNNGGDLNFVGIGISQGDRSLAFTGSQIPAHSTVIIQEQSAAAYSSTDPYYSATATTTPAEFGKSEDLISVKDNGDGTFSVINISEETLKEVKVFFKNYLPDEDIYVGGITYSITLEDVEPDTDVEVSASHYDVNYTVFVEITAER